MFDSMLLFADVQLPLLKRLEPAARVKVFAALGVVVLLGVTMMLLAWLGARATRRYMNSGQRRREAEPPKADDDWASKRLHDE